ncbi:Homocysteine S-methyltransferase [Scenedesmus sp. NREL 46B-D3]|nr:Homocysteine S-methyltransferase [Scenedesmus sp. NREL 46B-D3]
MLLLDGGLGHLLKENGLRIPGLPYDQQFLAGVLANEAAPDAVKAAHKQYIAAGCRCITTNNFVATRYSLAKVKREADVAQLTQLAGRLAREAVQESGRAVLVAGSLPPLQESYQSSGLPSAAAMQQEYSQTARALCADVDVFLAETLSTVAEADAALQATAQLGKPVWVSFTLEDSTSCCLRSKESLAAAVHSISQHAHLAAVLVNCCAPGAVTAALPVLKQHAPWGVHVGCYANGFQTTTTQWISGADQSLLQSDPDDYDARGIITLQAYAACAKAWQAAGAEYIGGCCGLLQPASERLRLLSDHHLVPPPA